MALAMIVASSLAGARAAAQGTPSQGLPTDSIFARTVPVSLHASAPARTLGADVTTITAEEIARSGASSVSELLEARVAGLSVLRQGGTVAEASRVQIRGAASMRFSTDPLIVFDGVPTHQLPANPSVVGSVMTSRLDDLPIDAIERIDVLRGPAAAALFGPGAAAGVIVITTARAQDGPWRSSARVDGGIIQDRTDYPANFSMLGTNTAGATNQPCSITLQADGTCTAQQLNRWNPLEQASPFRAGRELGAVTRVSGGLGSSGVAIALGASSRRLRGVTPDDAVTRSGAHLDLSRALGRAASAGATLEYGRRWSDLPVRGGIALPNDVITSALFGASVDDSAHGYRNGNPVFNPTHEDLEHVGFSARTSWQPRRWLTLSATGGHERSMMNVLRKQSFPPFGIQTITSASRLVHGDVGVGSEATSSLRGMRLTSALSYDDRQARIIEHDSSGLGVSFNASNYGLRHRYRALAWQERAAWSDAFFLNAGVSWNADGAVEALLRTPFTQIGASWLLPRVLGVSGARLRAARGVAGADASVTPISGLWTDPTLLSIPPARSDQDRERTQHTEFGFDAPLGRGEVRVTLYQALTRHMFVPSPAPPGTISPPPTDDGSMKNSGLELTLAQRVLSTRALQWDLTGTVSTIRSRVISLGEVGAIGTSNSRITPGHPFNGYWGRTITFSDANHDGLIAANEIQLSSQQQVYLGSSFPMVEASLRSDLRRGRWSVGLALDHRGGFKHLNGNEMLRCIRLLCRGAQDPGASLEEQARATFVRLTGDGAPYIQDASFVRLQELSLRWSSALPGVSGGRILDRMAVSVIARDLALWSRYGGLDPEVSTPLSFGGVREPGEEFGQSPIPMRLLLRVELLPPLP